MMLFATARWVGTSSASAQLKTNKENQNYIPLASTLASIQPAAIYYQTLGTAPNRMFVVEWYNNQHYSNSQKGVTFEAILYEGSNNIKFQYKNVEFGTVTGSISSDLPPYDKGGSATVGIEASSGSGLQYSYNQQVLSPELAILYKFPQYAGTNLYLSKLAPVMKEDSSDARKDTRFATSVDSPSLLNGVIAATFSRISDLVNVS